MFIDTHLLIHCIEVFTTKLDVLKKLSPQKYQVYILGHINIDFFKMQYPFYENVAYTYKTHQSNKSHGILNRQHFH